MLQKTALLGGSFNPVHNGHLHLLREVLFLTDYFRVILLPLNRPSHKEEEIRIAPEKRIDMLHLAIDSLNMNLQNKEILIDTCEIDRGGDTYTYDSVHGIYQRYEVEGRLGVIIGDDLLEGLPTWYRWKELRELVTFLVARRESSGTDSFVIPQDCTLEILENRQLEVSSSLIRGRISADLPVSHLVPEGVAAYMDAHGLYRL